MRRPRRARRNAGKVIMLVSAIVCAHDVEEYQDLVQAVTSLLEQTHRELEIIVVSDGSEQLYGRLVADYGDRGSVRPLLLEENRGVSAARNAGIGVARGEVIAFMDSDAIAEKTWIETLLDTHREHDAVAVGGRILPLWGGSKPDCLPEELYWLVGVTHEGFAGDGVTEIRNAFGPNMSFRRVVFEEVGLFNEDLGFAGKRTRYVQAEEPEYALRVRRTLGKGVVYAPDAVVYHKVPQSKLSFRVLLRRAFYQGYSKCLVRRLCASDDPMAAEKSYLRALMLRHVPGRLLGVHRLSGIKRLVVLVACVTSVGLGFVYGHVRRA